MSCSRIGALALLVLAVLWPPAATAQVSQITKAEADEALVVELNEGQLIHLERPAASVFLANPGVADINVRSTQLVYLLGRSPGQTTLFALDSRDNVIVSMDVVVKHNLTRLREALETLLPSAGIEVVSFEGGI
ncbi:MAG: hypothetical protein GWM93_17090, partial [Gemmatimonadetes bacterium]|nr:hypothetical protein [Gemmatimonadota bacterium]NIT68372.1 hypothetical protein [Gemmatimonadota bacterium]NIY36949.1 hypothetical protein [Gemmatimonadota bacterium]